MFHSTLLFAASLLAAAPDSDRLFKFLELDGAKTVHVLVMDHKDSSWRLYKCQTECKQESDLKVDAAGKAAFNMARGEHRVVVYNTNALVYAIQTPTAVDADVEGFAGLQEIVVSLGAGLQGLLSVGAKHFADPVAGGFGMGAGAAMTPRDKLLAFMDQAAKDYLAKVTPIKVAAGKVVEAQRVNDVDRAALVSAIQAFEIGKDFANPKLLTADHTVDFTNLVSVRAEYVPLKCLSQLTALRKLIALKRKAPIPPGELVDETENAAGLVQAIGTRTDSCKVDETTGVDPLKLITDVAALPSALPLDAPWVAPSEWVALETALAAYVSLGSDGAAVVKAADELLAKADAIMATAARVDATSKLIESTARNVKKGEKTEQVYFPEFLEVYERWSAPEWYKERTVTFAIAAAAPLQEPIVKVRPATVTGNYLLRNARLTFDVSFGLLFPFGGSPEDYEWGAVSVPGRTSKVLAVTSHASRRAAPTAILTLQHDALRKVELSPGLDIGVGADPDRLFFSLGGSFQFASFLRLGFAHAWHRVKALEPPQKAAMFDSNNQLIANSFTEIASKDDIRTRNALGEGWQMYLVFSLRGLNPFKGK